MLSLCFAISLSAKNEVYEITDAGVLTLEDLSKIEESGVTKTDPLTYLLSKDLELKGTTGFKLENKSVVKMNKDVLVRVYGPVEFAVTDTATVCPAEEGVDPKGFHFYKMKDDANVIGHVRFEGVGLNVSSPQGTVFENCTFYKSNGVIAKAPITYSAASINNAVRNCSFLSTKFSGVANGANVAAGITVENCLFDKCSTEGRNYPYINLTVSGNNGGSYVRNNKIIGGKGLMAGAISVANLMGIIGENNAVVENNEMCDCRYGISVTGGAKVRILNNKIINCHYESKAVNGGSGIAISSSSATLFADVYVEGNLIDGSIWGVTIIKTAKANLGYLTKDNPDIEYNPGNNIFRNNGNCGVAPEGELTSYDPSKPFDLYNNTANTVYAQGNTWGGPDQSAEEIEKRIFHKPDDANLGEVIFMPEGSGSGIELTEAEVFVINVNGDHSFTVSGVDENTPVTVYDFNGSVLWRGTAGQTVSLGKGGAVVVAAGNVARSIIL